MPGYSAVLIAVGSLACLGALGWFLESAADHSEINEDAVSEDTMQQQRVHIYMAAVVVAMCAFIA
jgi:hypothetical protein